MIGREGTGPERAGPDYPPEWDTEPAECSCLPYPYGDGPEFDCPQHGATERDRAAMAADPRDEHDQFHPVWIEGCDGCVDRAEWLEQQRHGVEWS